MIAYRSTVALRGACFYDLRRCLVWLGMSTLLRFEVHKTLRCPESTLQNWLTLVEANYNANPYHNSTHAGDVLHAIACFLDSEKVGIVQSTGLRAINTH